MSNRSTKTVLASVLVLTLAVGVIAEDEKHVLADAYLDDLWMAVDTKIVVVTDSALSRVIRENLLAALYLPIQETPGPEERTVYTCLKKDTRFKVEQIPAEDYDALLHYAKHPGSYATGSTELAPAEYETVSKQVCVQPATSRQEIIPAKYETRMSKVLVQPARKEYKLIPAQIKETRSRILVRRARSEWRRVPCDSGQLTEGESSNCCWMLVQIPAQFRERVSRVCTQPARWGWADVPAEYEIREEQVIVTPEVVRSISVPAVYSSVEEERMVKPAVKRGVGMRFGPEFGDVQDAYWLPKSVWDSDAETRPPARDAWDDPGVELPNEWMRIGGVRGKQRTAPDLGTGDRLEGYVFVRGSKGASGPLQTTLEVGSPLVVDEPERFKEP